jgi:hypothetical protein
MKMRHPVSVIIVIYNGVKYIPDCMQSVFEQVRTDDQVIVVDNASIDNGVELITLSWPETLVIMHKPIVGSHRLATRRRQPVGNSWCF